MCQKETAEKIYLSLGLKNSFCRITHSHLKFFTISCKQSTGKLYVGQQETYM